jgi:MoxR-like ATPase
LQQAAQLLAALRGEMAKAVIGQQAVIDEVLIALLADAHVLIEGVPGLGKTLLVKALARTFGGQTRRIQFTPDLMPSDVVGHTLFDAATARFVTRQGPVFTHLLLADEINRAPAKTQSALLEAMQEKQVTLEGNTSRLPQPFMVLATQNPIEQEGTYPLPEAQLDRFLLKIRIDYPSEQEEMALTRQVTSAKTGADLDVEAVATLIQPATVVGLQQWAAHVDARRARPRLCRGHRSRQSRYARTGQRRRAARPDRAGARGAGAGTDRPVVASPPPTTSRQSPCRRCATA